MRACSWQPLAWACSPPSLQAAAAEQLRPRLCWPRTRRAVSACAGRLSELWSNPEHLHNICSYKPLHKHDLLDEITAHLSQILIKHTPAQLLGPADRDCLGLVTWEGLQRPGRAVATGLQLCRTVWKLRAGPGPAWASVLQWLLAGSELLGAATKLEVLQLSRGTAVPLLPPAPRGQLWPSPSELKQPLLEGCNQRALPHCLMETQVLPLLSTECCSKGSRLCCFMSCLSFRDRAASSPSVLPVKRFWSWHYYTTVLVGTVFLTVFSPTESPMGAGPYPRPGFVSS